MKKLVVLILMSFLTLSICAKKKVAIDGIYYYIDAKTKQAGVTYNKLGGATYFGDVIIPETVNYEGIVYNVVYIDASAFRNCTSLTSVVLPNSIADIGESAFEVCTSLKSIVLPSGITKIATYSFSSCTSLSSISLPGSVREIGASAFDNCSSLKSIVLPQSITKINKSTFQNCTSLTSITLPNSITEIGEYSFAHCRGLSTIVFSDNLKIIDHYSFKGCSNITSLTIPQSVTYIGKNAFEDCIELKTFYCSHNFNYGTNVFLGCNELDRAYVPRKLIRYYEGMLPITTDVLNIEEGVGSNQPATEYAVIAQAGSGNNAMQSLPEVVSDVDQQIPVSTESQNENTFAVIIGNEKYSQVSPVQFAKKDALIFAEYCKKTLGLPAENVRVYEDATYAMMMSAVKNIQDISKAYRGNVNVIFYYAGHGIPNEKDRNAYLLPIDVDGSQTSFCYSLGKLYHELGSMNSKNVIVLLDACFSGSLRGDGMLMAARGVAIKAKVTAPKGNMVVLSAAKGEETAYPYKEKGHGMFTYFLLKNSVNLKVVAR